LYLANEAERPVQGMLPGLGVSEEWKTDRLLDERGNTHGSFAENARISHKLKTIFRRSSASLTFVQREALDMIALKLSRILSGAGGFADHWRDVAGYATLAVKEIEGEPTSKPCDCE
jgi:hypothetical protein